MSDGMTLLSAVLGGSVPSVEQPWVLLNTLEQASTSFHCWKTVATCH